MTQYIHGLHASSVHDGWGSTGADLMLDRPGWIVFTESIGHDKNNLDGGNYTPWLGKGFHVIVRLNNGYGIAGTIPLPAFYDDFAKRVAQYIYSSPLHDGIIWSIGNEPNHPQEWPEDMPISPEQYAYCFTRCWDVVKAIMPNVDLCVGAIAPWCPFGEYGWQDYLVEVLELAGTYDGVLLHTYTHGHDPALTYSVTKMAPPFDYCYYEFQSFRNFMDVLPPDVPVYITETNPGAEQSHPQWDNVNNGWYQTALGQISVWNKENPHNQIRCLAAYRYPQHDSWSMVDKPNVLEDFKAGVDLGYTWKEDGKVPDEWTIHAQTSCNDGFYDYQDIGELTMPKGNGYLGDAFPLYEHDRGNSGSRLVRPEYDARAEPHVHTAPHAAGMFSMSATQEGCIVFPVSVAPGTDVRASVWTNANDATGSGYGTRVGIATENPGQGAIEVTPGDEGFTGALEALGQWGEWNTKIGDTEWEQLWSPVVQSTGSKVWVLLLLRKRYADPAHSHWDDLVVEVRGSTTPPQPPSGLGDQLRDVANSLDVLAQDVRAIAADVDLLQAGTDPQAIALVQQSKDGLEQALTLMGG